MYWKTPKLIYKTFNNFEWHRSRYDKNIYLTFDDGPTPGITEQVLNILDKYNAKATFFCLGRNVDRHRDLFNEIISRKHEAGNHTYSHLKGWRTPAKLYIQDTELAQKYIQSRLFRPPYGRITRLQTKYIRKKFRIIMWDVLSHDYNMKIPKKMCLRKVIKSTENGSIVVFHDSIKASKNLLYVLPRFIEHFQAKGFIFKSINDY